MTKGMTKCSFVMSQRTSRVLKIAIANDGTYANPADFVSNVRPSNESSLCDGLSRYHHSHHFFYDPSSGFQISGFEKRL